MENRINPPSDDFDKPKRNNTWIYIVIILLLLGTNVYLFLQRKDKQQQNIVISEQLQTVTTEKDTLQMEYNAALARLDQLKSKSAEMGQKLTHREAEIQQLKKKIQTILTSEHATKSQLGQAKVLIANLNEKINNYQTQIVTLQHQNTTLTTQRDSFAQKNQNLQKKIDIAKILHASNIRLIPINLRRGGRREKTTTKARKVDLLRITFDIDKNTLAESGPKEFDIRIINPNGHLLSNTALGSGSFIDSRGKTLNYSVSKTINLVSGVPLKNIDVDWHQADSYLKGPYAVEIYYQGHIIGHGTVELR